MSEDHLLRSLGRLAREEDEAESASLDERWDRLAAGTLTPEEEAELRALAETSPEAREIYEAFRPLDAGFQARVVEAINWDREGEAPAPERPEPPPRTLPFRRGGARLGWLATAGLAAASLLLFLRMPLAPRLPAYEVMASGDTQALRGRESPRTESLGPLLFVVGSTLTLNARPAERVAGRVEARALLEREGRIVPWKPDPPLEVLNGAVRLRGTLGRQVQLPSGISRIWLVIGRPGDLPPPEELERELRAGRTGDGEWRAVYQDVRIERLPRAPGSEGSPPPS